MRLIRSAANKPKVEPQILAEANLTDLTRPLRGPHWHSSAKAVAFTVTGTIPELRGSEYDFEIWLTASDLSALFSAAIRRSN
jgi:hypothetical protein